MVSGQACTEAIRTTLDAVPWKDRDAWVDRLLQVGEVSGDGPDLPPGCVPYLPCPVSAVVEMVDRAEVGPNDVFVDVGCGVGRAVFLTHLLTGAAGLGVEVQSSLVKLASAHAERLNLPGTRFIHGDAVDELSPLNLGTVFFLYCPFSGERLERLLGGLASLAKTRRIRICCVDMPRLEHPWLRRLDSTSPELDLYRSV